MVSSIRLLLWTTGLLATVGITHKPVSAAPAAGDASDDDTAVDWKRGMRGEGGNMIDFYAQRGKRTFVDNFDDVDDEIEDELEFVDEGPLIERILPLGVVGSHSSPLKPNGLLSNFYKRGLVRPNSLMMNVAGKRGFVRPNGLVMNSAGKRGYMRPNSMMVNAAGKRGYNRPNGMVMNLAGKRGFMRPNGMMTNSAGKRGMIRPNGIMLSPQMRATWTASPKRGGALMRPNGVIGPVLGKRNPNRMIPTNLGVGKRGEGEEDDDDGQHEIEEHLKLERRALQADRVRDLVKMTAEAQGDEDREGEDFVKSVRVAYYGGGGRWGRGLDNEEKFFPARG